jgi:hypothetical protein
MNSQESYSLFGYDIPFPTKDLYIAVIAVAGFLPATVLVHFLVSRALALLKPKRD